MGKKGQPASARATYNSAKGRLDRALAKGKIKSEAEYNQRLANIERIANIDVDGEELRRQMNQVVDQGE